MGACEEIGQTEYLRNLSQKIIRLRIPFSGGLEITSRCNLRCVHCYLCPATAPRPERPEIEKERVCAILDEVRDAGCLHLLITGGEPLLRPDFRDIYEHAKRIGMLVTVFSNGTLITEGLLELFADLPPCNFEISLYGATAEIYEAVTRVRGSFRACIRGIEGLLGIGVDVSLKTILMTINRHEFFEIERTANAYGVRFRFDACLFPRIDGNQTPLAFRVSADEAVEREYSEQTRFFHARKFFDEHINDRVTEKLYGCGAGLVNFHIDSLGHLLPCIMARDFRYDLFAGSFLDGWNRVIPLFREQKTRADHACIGCEAVAVCGRCPAFFRLENGDDNVPSEYLCRIGKLRHAAMCANIT